MQMRQRACCCKRSRSRDGATHVEVRHEDAGATNLPGEQARWRLKQVAAANARLLQLRGDALTLALALALLAASLLAAGLLARRRGRLGAAGLGARDAAGARSSVQRAWRDAGEGARASAARRPHRETCARAAAARTSDVRRNHAGDVHRQVRCRERAQHRQTGGHHSELHCVRVRRSECERRMREARRNVQLQRLISAAHGFLPWPCPWAALSKSAFQALLCGNVYIGCRVSTSAAERTHRRRWVFASKSACKADAISSGGMHAGASFAAHGRGAVSRARAACARSGSHCVCGASAFCNSAQKAPPQPAASRPLRLDVLDLSRAAAGASVPHVSTAHCTSTDEMTWATASVWRDAPCPPSPPLPPAGTRTPPAARKRSGTACAFSAACTR